MCLCVCFFLRLDTGEVWRDRLREIVTAPIPRREEKDDYEQLFKEILPSALWNFATSDESASYDLPFVRLKEVRFSGSTVVISYPFGVSYPFGISFFFPVELKLGTFSTHG